MAKVGALETRASEEVETRRRDIVRWDRWIRDERWDEG